MPRWIANAHSDRHRDFDWDHELGLTPCNWSDASEWNAQLDWHRAVGARPHSRTESPQSDRDRAAGSRPRKRIETAQTDWGHAIEFQSDLPRRPKLWLLRQVVHVLDTDRRYKSGMQGGKRPSNAHQPALSTKPGQLCERQGIPAQLSLIFLQPRQHLLVGLEIDHAPDAFL